MAKQDGDAGKEINVTQIGHHKQLFLYFPIRFSIIYEECMS